MIFSGAVAAAITYLAYLAIIWPMRVAVATRAASPAAWPATQRSAHKQSSTAPGAAATPPRPAMPPIKTVLTVSEAEIYKAKP